jgi:hypothetical protein
MSARHAIIVVAVILFAGALLFAADYKSSLPTPPQASNFLQVR